VVKNEEISTTDSTDSHREISKKIICENPCNLVVKNEEIFTTDSTDSHREISKK
jgi:hypothetical protein